MESEGGGDAGELLMYQSNQGPLTISDGDVPGSKRLILQKLIEGSRVEVVVGPNFETIKEILADGSSIMLSNDDNIVTETFNDGCVSRLDRQRFLKTIQLAPDDGNILIQVVLQGPRKGHITVQCMDGTCVVIDEVGTRTVRLVSPKSRRRSSASQSPRARPPKCPPPVSRSRSSSSMKTSQSPTSDKGQARSRARTQSSDLNNVVCIFVYESIQLRN